MMNRFDYLFWAFKKSLRSGAKADTCPACGGTYHKIVKRKYYVTALQECQNCLLRFRTPQDDRSSRKKIADVFSNNNLKYIGDANLAI